MNIKETLLVVLVTVPDEKTALALSRKIISERLAACVNILPGLRSIYSWQGNIEDSSEQLLLIKTPRSLFQPLQARVLELHPYDTPEVVALQAADVSEGYLAWVLEETSRR